jgi:hypothetical protein
MTTIIKWLNSPYVTGVLLVLGACTDLILIGRACDLGKSDWAAWVQAVGSVAAILVAVWIANRDNRKRNHDAYTLAIIAATEFFEPLQKVMSSVFDVHNMVAGATDPQYTRMYLLDARTRLENLRRWSSDDISRLAPLPDDCARRIARAQLNVVAFLDMRFADFVIDSVPGLTQEQRVEWCRQTALNILEIADDILKAQNVLSTASARITRPDQWHLAQMMDRPRATDPGEGT